MQIKEICDFIQRAEHTHCKVDKPQNFEIIRRICFGLSNQDHNIDFTQWSQDQKKHDQTMGIKNKMFGKMIDKMNEIEDINLSIENANSRNLSNTLDGILKDVNTVWETTYSCNVNYKDNNNHVMNSPGSIFTNGLSEQ